MREIDMAAATSVKLDDDMKARVQALAESRRRTSHWIMREAIAQYVEREEKREALRQDTLKAWDEFQRTGQHATAEAVDDWLASWGSDAELTPPECRE
jgi:predicted transcriptional regulator